MAAQKFIVNTSLPFYIDNKFRGKAMATPDTKGHRQVPAVRRAAAILRLLGRADRPLGVNQVARELGLVPSTCLHILRELAQERLVAFDPETKRYALDIGILAIARAAISRNDFASLVQPHLTELSQRFGITAIAVQMSGPAHMIVVALSRASVPFRLQVDMGSRFPALISATGRCVAAFGDMDDDALRTGFEALHWENPPGFEEWRAQVDETRQRGYGLDEGNYIGGVTILAVPLLGRDGRLQRSIVAAGMSERVQAHGTATIAAEMTRLRDDIAATLLENAATPAGGRGA